MGKLWQKQYTLDSLIEEFTVGQDYLLDQELVAADCVSSMAHARMLNSIGILSDSEGKQLVAELREIIDKNETGSFSIGREDEDCHTAIENHLTESLGEVGKKIHTGRSRNDQVIAALRLHARQFCLILGKAGLLLIKSLIDFAAENRDVPMPGRTHMQVAMPSSVGLWAGAYAEELTDHLVFLSPLLDLVNRNPLGSAASYGVPLPLDRELVADLLGFAAVQNNVLSVNNSRGMTEAWMLTLADHLCLTLSRLAQDLMLFTLPELGYFSLPEELCSGSSIMPQKKNPDLLEATRSKSALVSSWAGQTRAIIHALPSGYNRDVQDTKEPYLRGSRVSVLCLQVMHRVISLLEVDRDRLTAAFVPEIFATDEALRLVEGGMSFREAYRATAAVLSSLETQDAASTITSRTATGTAGNLNLESLSDKINTIEKKINTVESKANEAIAKLAGRQVSFF